MAPWSHGQRGGLPYPMLIGVCAGSSRKCPGKFLVERNGVSPFPLYALQRQIGPVQAQDSLGCVRLPVKKTNARELVSPADPRALPT